MRKIHFHNQLVIKTVRIMRQQAVDMYSILGPRAECQQNCDCETLNKGAFHLTIRIDWIAIKSFRIIMYVCLYISSSLSVKGANTKQWCNY